MNDLDSPATGSFELEPLSEKWEWVADGVWGDHGLRILPGGGFRIPRAQIGALDIHGPNAEVSVCAWIKRESDSPWQALAGVWDESRAKRQYFLFLNARSRTLSESTLRVPCQNRIHGHVSDIGGATPGLECCVTYATGAKEIPLQRWVFVAMTFAKGESRVFVDGRLDKCPESNPFQTSPQLFDGGKDGADFTVGMNSVRQQWSNPFGGTLGGLAVYRRALKAEELQTLFRSRPSS
ncbi:MAG: LamG domain-containing protein [Verrucomicrobia bacterium]|nr:LamG domain-containing protein [Verrucomicrobiota bacterium]MCH8514422.1 LamG domain-containing protein [Kiritimatiellia bacterium]